MKLISMTDFVLNIEDILTRQEEEEIDDYNYRVLITIDNYANFLKQPLTLGMFVPVDEEGNFLMLCDCSNECGYCKENIDLQKAKSAILFEGFEIVKMEGGTFYTNGTLQISVINDKLYFDLVFENKLPISIGRLIDIEGLINYDLTLTETEIKMIYGN